jgi:hypothetical protein
LATQLTHAQDFGALIGVHQTTADSKTANTTTDSGFNFKAGLTVNFELDQGSYFRTGILYNQRHFDTEVGSAKTKVKFDYIDIPANYQYNFTETFGLFGGLVVAANVGDSRSPAQSPKIDAEGLVPLIDLGVNLTFQNMIGFDVYYERGLGKFADDLQNFSTFGLNFLYWF